MPQKSLPATAAALAATPTIDAALGVLGEEIAALDRGAHVALFTYDERRGALVERIELSGQQPRRVPVEISLDHFPVPVQTALQHSRDFADCGEESASYIALLGVAGSDDDCWLVLRAVGAEGALAAVLALHEPRRRFGPRLAERVEPVAQLFELAFIRHHERAARTEAVAVLEAVTQRIHAEYERSLGELRAEIAQLQDDARRNRPSEARRVAELEAAAAAAAASSAVMARRLAAVEEQVAVAVGRLEQAHIQLHEQSAVARTQASMLRHVEQILTAPGERDLQQRVGDALAIIAARS